MFPGFSAIDERYRWATPDEQFRMWATITTIAFHEKQIDWQYFVDHFNSINPEKPF